MNVSLLDRRSGRGAQNAADGVDPRIAARRASVREERRRRWRRVAAAILTVGVAGALLWFVSRSPLFDIDQIRVVGTARSQVDGVLTTSGLSVGDPLISVDTGAVARRLEQQPWVRTAKVGRDINGVVSITIVERIAIAWIDDGFGGRTLVDAAGVELGPVAPEDASLPQVVGLGEGSLELASILPPGVRSRTTLVEQTDDVLRLRLRPQGTVEFGPATDLSAKVASLVTVMGQVDQQDLCTIRVINPDTPVVTRTPICG
jgi:cell division protein FtsQ